MRVLHVDSAGSWRGGQNQVLLTAAGMRARGHAVRIACRQGGALEARARAAGIDVTAMPLRGDLSLCALPALHACLRAFRPDIVQAHDPHALAALACVPPFGAVRCLIATRRVDFRVRGPASRLKYGRAVRVIAVSEAIARVLAEGRIAPERIRVVYEGVLDRAAVPGGRDVFSAWGIPSEAPVVGNIAALTDHKDHRTLLDAAAAVCRAHERVHFVVAGDGEERAGLEARIRAEGLAARVHLVGFREDVDRLLPAFTVFCLSSHMEGLGTSLLDAMAFARPIVATAAGGIPEIVEHGVTGRLVPPRDPRRLADALLAVLRDEEGARALGQAGRRRFERYFTAERMVENTLAVYGELT